MVTPPKPPHPASLAELAELRLAVTALLPVRQAALHVHFEAVHNSLEPRAIDALGSALRNSAWLRRRELEKVRPATPPGRATSQAAQPPLATSLCASCRRRIRPPGQRKRYPATGRCRFRQLWFWPPEEVEIRA